MGVNTGKQFAGRRWLDDVIIRAGGEGFDFFVLAVIGRKDNLVKIRGFRVELGDIESQLRQHKTVSGAVVMAPRAGEPISPNAQAASRATV